MSVWTKISGKCFPYCWISGTKIKIFWWNKKAQISTCCVKPVNWCIRLYLTKYSYCRLLYQILHIIRKLWHSKTFKTLKSLGELCKSNLVGLSRRRSFWKAYFGANFLCIFIRLNWLFCKCSILWPCKHWNEPLFSFSFFNRWTYLNLQKLLSLNTSTSYYN